MKRKVWLTIALIALLALVIVPRIKVNDSTTAPKEERTARNTEARPVPAPQKEEQAQPAAPVSEIFSVASKAREHRQNDLEFLEAFRAEQRRLGTQQETEENPPLATEEEVAAAQAQSERVFAGWEAEIEALKNDRLTVQSAEARIAELESKQFTSPLEQISEFNQLSNQIALSDLPAEDEARLRNDLQLKASNAVRDAQGRPHLDS